MQSPLVTIVTPSYNQGRFIRATIESVLNQSYPRLEYIIMDGGSTDETPAIVKEYSSRVTWISEKDRGQSHAINKGFRMAQGEIVSWLNSDDTLLPGAICHAVKAFEAEPNLGAVYGEGYRIDVNGNILGRFQFTEPFNLWKLVYLYDYILQQTVFFRRAVFEKIGYLDEELHWGMDWDILIRIGKEYGLGYVPEYMGCLREHDEAKTASGGAIRFRELAALMRRHGGMRFPPGYFFYGLGTYEAIWREAIRKCTPSFLQGASAKIQKILYLACHYVIQRIATEAQGWYRDGWATTQLKYMLPRGNGEIHIQGCLPDLGRELRDQSLQIEGNGKILREFRIGFGDFHVTAPVDSDAPLHLQIKASRYVVPSRSGIGRDGRRLAYQLKSIERSA